MIYLLFIALPVIGLVMMYNRGNPWFAFGMTMPYASEANFERVDSLKSWHETLANLGYFVIGCTLRLHWHTTISGRTTHFYA
ncbi:cytochrome b561 [Escherichia coli]|uniref:Cytochrome b561 n=1 Tax=Escherichia coli TaxID=562 RepID=A0A447XG72_ECOLX|nr:cytochrome b561 [Escherichia coli]